MGNRASLTFGDHCQFEANNCLPVTWLSLFDPNEYLVETIEEDGEEFTIARYQTTQLDAYKRAEYFIQLLKRKPGIWSFLRPIEILREELQGFESKLPVVLDVTQLWAIDDTFQHKVKEAAGDFKATINSLRMDGIGDMEKINRLVSNLCINPGLSIVDIDPEERMFLFIGTYWGDPHKENLYSLEYFGEDFWKAI